MLPAGGSEILYQNLLKNVDKFWFKKINVISSITRKEVLDKSRINLLWQHLNSNEENTFGLCDPDFFNQLAKIVFVSEWQRQKFKDNLDFPFEKSCVIHNAIEKIEYLEKSKTSKLKLIYTSTPWRGLDVLIEAFKLLNRTDIELDVYSSTVIYGKDFLKNKFDWLFDKCRLTKGVNYKGYAVNKAVRRALQHAHIFAYPSVFEETSCLAAIEAGAAGCRIVTTDYGALKETCGDYAEYIPYNLKKSDLVESYAKVLESNINNYWSYTDKLRKQADYFNDYYSWNNRKHQWTNLFKEL